MAKSAMKDLTGRSAHEAGVRPCRAAAWLLFQQMYNFVDTAIVGRFLGSAALAAVGATGSLNFLILAFAWASARGSASPLPSPSAPRMNWSCAAM